MIFHVSDQTFPNLIKSPKNVVIIFGAPSRCPACVKQEEIMDKFVNDVHEHTGVYPALFFADVETNPQLDADYGQNGVPRAYVFRDGMLVFDFIGMFSPYQLEELLQMS